MTKLDLGPWVCDRRRMSSTRVVSTINATKETHINFLVSAKNTFNPKQPDGSSFCFLVSRK